MSRPRTFGELVAARQFRISGHCAFCKQYRHDAVKYSTRHYVCNDCAAERADVVMPAVKKRERFEADIAKIRAGAKS